MKKGKKKHQELSKDELFQFLIGDPAYPGNDKDYKNGLKIYRCSIIKKGQNYCSECSKFPCGKYEDIKESMKRHGYQLIKYQKNLGKAGKEE